MMTIMKMLRLLLAAAAYGCIVQIVQEMKNKHVRHYMSSTIALYGATYMYVYVCLLQC